MVIELLTTSRLFQNSAQVTIRKTFPESDIVQLILASSSVFRKTVLAKLKLKFTQISPNIDETSKLNESSKDLVKRLAVEKARAVASNLPSNENSLIISSDQVAVCDGVIFGKPGNHEAAIEQLQFESGKIVNFYTSLALLNSANGRVQEHVDATKVHFRTLNNSQIETYLKTDQPYNCAGSFKSEAFGASLFTKIETEDPDALIGLPLLTLVTMLTNEGMDPLTKI